MAPHGYWSRLKRGKPAKNGEETGSGIRGCTVEEKRRGAGWRAKTRDPGLVGCASQCGASEDSEKASESSLGASYLALVGGQHTKDKPVTDKQTKHHGKDEVRSSSCLRLHAVFLPLFFLLIKSTAFFPSCVSEKSNTRPLPAPMP